MTDSEKKFTITMCIFVISKIDGNACSTAVFDICRAAKLNMILKAKQKKEVLTWNLDR